MQLIKTTYSVCSTCLLRIPARVYEREGAVYLDKTCPTHGREEALLASDAGLYWSGGTSSGTGCCAVDHSCTMIFEITERCNLSCPTCFSDSSPQQTWQMSLSEFSDKLDRLLALGKQDADMVQLSGGEPTIHPDLEKMVELCFDRGVRKIYINTNGIRLAREPAFVERLAAIDGGRDRLQFYLQFDGVEERTNQLIRGAKGLFPIKQQAIANIHAAGLYALPVMTVTRGINDTEIGAVIRLMRDNHPKMNTVILQPAFYAGRYENERRVDRLTLAEVASEVAKQTDGMFGVEDFGPIPCSDPNCFALAVAMVQGDEVIPISRYFPRFETWQQPAVAGTIDKLRDRMPQHMLDVLAEDDLLDSLLDLMAEDDDSADWSDYRNFILVGIKPFMDAHTYDQDRIDACCVHVIDRDGNPVSLCEYNTLRRPRGLL